MPVSRRHFIARAAAVLGAGGLLPALAASCGGIDPDPQRDAGTGDESRSDAATNAEGGELDAGSRCLSEGTAVSIGANHGHSLTVSRADVAAGTERSYHIQGGALHDHTVTLTAAHFATLAGGQPVTVSSSDDAFHSHAVTVRCA